MAIFLFLPIMLSCRKKYSTYRNKECVLWKIIVHLVSILTACGYTKSLEEDKDGLKSSVVILSESTNHNRSAAMTFLRKISAKTLRCMSEMMDVQQNFAPALFYIF